MSTLMAKIVMLAALVSLAVVADGPSIERGKELFTSAQLGTTGKSCDSCHIDAKGLEQAAVYDEGQLRVIINQCIKKSLRGNVIDPASPEMKSIVMYIQASSNSAHK